LNLKIINGISGFPVEIERTVATIGTFDGLHLGHQAILEQLTVAAQSSGMVPLAITFEPHPRVFVTPQTPPPLLTIWEEKKKLFESYLKFGYLLVLEFNESIIGIVHAGWRGAISGVIKQAIASMCSLSNDQSPDSIGAILGPCAQVCCYQVSNDFLTQVDTPLAPIKNLSKTERESIRDRVILCINNQQYFNLPAFIVGELRMLGLLAEYIDMQYSICTIHTPLYCSYRRDKIHARRNISLAWLTL